MKVDKELCAWETKNVSLKRLDGDRVRLNRTYGLLEHQALGGSPYPTFISGETIKEANVLVSRLERGLNKLESVSLNDFDAAVLVDVGENVRRIHASMNYLYNPKEVAKIANLLSVIYGNGAYTQLQAMLKGVIHSRVLHRASADDFARTWIQREPEFESVRAALLGQLEKYKELVQKICVDTGLLEDKLEYDLALSPPLFGFSFWDDTTRLAAMNPKLFSQDGNVSATALNHFNHEIIGHNLNFRFSRNMPRGLLPDEQGYLTQIQGVLGEGVALYTMDFALGWMKRNRNLFKGKFNDPERIPGAEELYISRKLWQIVYDVLAFHDTENEDNTNYRREHRPKLVFAELTGNPRFFRDFYLFDDRTFSETLADLQYVMGRIQTKNIVSALRKEIDFRKPKNRTAAMKMLLQGFWTSPQAKKMFVTGPLLARMKAAGEIV
ncbi:MAG: hypothetical protein ABIB47_01105 [Candidatus Woesearchaeota archaeon]